MARAKIMAIAARSGLPIAPHVDCATPHEVKLVPKTIESSFLVLLSERIISDKTYDKDPLDEEFEQMGVQMIAPHKVNRKRSI